MAEEHNANLENENEKNEAQADLIQEIEAFVEETEENKRILFYRSPKLRQFWGEEQVELESWKELFFDLIFVAVAFNLGTVLEELIEDDAGFIGALFFYAQFLVLYTAWYYRMLYLSRFVPNSIFHSILDMVFALFLALAAALISTRNEITDAFENINSSNSSMAAFFAAESSKSIGFNSPLGFSMLLILLTLVNVFRNFELLFVVQHYGLQPDITEELRQREQKAIVASGKVALIGNVAYMICLGISIVGAITGTEELWVAPLFLGFFVLFLFLLFVRLVSMMFGIKQQEYVPINVGFVIKRIGEFTMLMIGEGVLQIIITDVDGDNLDGHFKTFSFAFLVSASLFALAFYFLPYEPEDHAFRKSSFAGLFTTMISPATLGSIIGVGVTLKLILKKQAKLDEEDVIIRTFPLGLTIVTVSIILQKMASHGYIEITRRDFTSEGKHDKSLSNVHFERIFFSILFLLSPFLFYILRIPIKKLEGSIFLLMSLGVFCIIFIIGIIEHKLFLKEVEEEDDHLIKIDEEMIEKYDKASGIISQDRSSIMTKKNGCSVTHMLHYLRKKTREIDAQIEGVKNGKVKPEESDWEELVNDLVKTSNLINQTFYDYRAKKLQQEQEVKVSSRKIEAEEEEEEEVNLSQKEI